MNLNPDVIRAVCESATAHNFGRTVHQVITPAGSSSVLVRLSSWPRMREALLALHDLGYACTEHGTELRVTGWDGDRLNQRLAILREQRGHLENRVYDLACEAVNRYLALVVEEDVPHDEAQARATAQARTDCASYLHSSGYRGFLPPDPDDSPVGQLLRQARIEEQAIAGLLKDQERIGEAVIGLLNEYQGCYAGYEDDESAAAAALRDVREGLQALAEIATIEAELDAEQQSEGKE